jgi:hypothetical protein
MNSALPEALQPELTFGWQRGEVETVSAGWHTDLDGGGDGIDPGCTLVGV